MAQEQDMIYLAFVVIAGTALIVGFVLWLEARRRQDLKAAASWLDFEFQPKPDAALTQELKAMNIFRASHSERAYNVLVGTQQEVTLRICDYRYTIGYGRGAHTHRQSMALVHLDGVTLPEFRLSTERFYHRLGKLMGFQDIDFESAPVFSRRYVLKAQDESAVRDLFSPQLLRFFEQGDRIINVAVCKGRVAVFYPDRVLAGHALRGFVEMVGELTQLLASNQQTQN